MRIKTRNTTRIAVVLGSALVAAAIMLPASAGATPAAQLEASTAAGATAATETAADSDAAAKKWKNVNSKGGWIKKCKRQGCKKVASTSWRAKLQWDRRERNKHGNLWYHVRYRTAGNLYKGWIYCGNLFAPC